MANFGYLPLDDHFQNIQENHQIIKLDGQKDNNRNILEFIQYFKNNDQFPKIWDKIYKNVKRVTNITNNLLQVYHLNYELNLLPTDLFEKIKGNFSLKYKLGQNKTLSDKDIESSVSYGELNIISLCLFITSCLIRRIPQNSQFIFDDPISSYDLNKLQITINIINNIIIQNKNVTKIYFLSHEKHFIQSLIYPLAKKDISFWHMTKSKNTELISVKKMKGDFEYYKNLVKSKDRLTQLIAQRYFVEFWMQLPNIKEIESQLSNIRKIRAQLLNIRKNINNEIYGKSNQNFSNPLNHKNKERIISWKTYLKLTYPSFWTKWLPKQMEQIIHKIINSQELNKNEMTIFRVTMYRGALNSLAHSDKGNDISLDISRTSEIVENIYSNYKNIVNDIDLSIDIWKNEKNK